MDKYEEERYGWKFREELINMKRSDMDEKMKETGEYVKETWWKNEYVEYREGCVKMDVEWVCGCVKMDVEWQSAWQVWCCDEINGIIEQISSHTSSPGRGETNFQWF